jgi:DNA polymerase-3 subunit delta'
MGSKSIRRLPHGLLCHGPAGLGKTLFAERLAQALLCQRPEVDGAPCGACRACRLFSVGNHPDFSPVKPADGGKPIRVDQIRQLNEFLGYTSKFGGYKIALIAPADALNINAANSLLKTLEEPPPQCVLILVTASPSRLAATVRSRCQDLGFTLPPREQALAWLAGRLQGPMNPEPALLLNLGGGAPLAALALAEPGRWARRQTLFESYRNVLLGKIDPIRAAEAWVNAPVAESIRWLSGWHMDMIRLKMVSASRLLNVDLEQALLGLAAELPTRVLFQRLDAVYQLQQLVETTQANPRIMIEGFFSSCMGE